MHFKLTLILIFFSLSIFAEEIPSEKAKKAAENFLISSNSTNLKSISNINLNLVSIENNHPFSSTQKSSEKDNQLIYIFNVNDTDGFIIVSGDDKAMPILGYSFESSFSENNIPENLRKWLEGYKEQIRLLQANPGVENEVANNLWESLLTGNYSSKLKSTSSVDPLVSTKWNQSPYYNDLCPYDANNEGYSVTGCVATAMAQIMKFWNYPKSGSGFHSYNHANFGVISANFGDTDYDWASMPNIASSENNAVATLMFHCGVSVEMNYSALSSGAYVAQIASPIEHCTEYALEEYFGYDTGLTGVLRNDNTKEEWTQLLKQELDQGRPIAYAGVGQGGGHAFVCDGYDSNDFFHFNWGWGGFQDGYFAMDALSPEGVGIGGGAGDYNSNQHAIIGIKPPDDLIEYDLSLYDDLTISENPLFFTDAYTIHTDIGNFGANTFTGDYSVAIFDEDLIFVEFTEVLEGNTLDGSMHYTGGVDFNSTGSLEMLPGNYYAGVVYRPTGGNWKFVGDGSYDNFLEISVYYSSDIELYSDLTLISGTTITQEEAFTVSVDILNDASITFTGEFAIELYDMEGSFAGTVETITGASLEAGFFYDDVLFTSQGLSIDPGTYLMALMHKPDGGEWTLSGSSYYSNPIKVIMKEAPLSEDSYENNDEEITAYELPLNYTSNTASVSTVGSNVHIGTDIDHYSINLESGYNYSVSARIHDSYNSGNQEIYTLDVLWAFDAHGYWSEVYDDVMSGNIEVSDGGEIMFGIAPYFEGETGTYLLDIEVTRTEIVSTETFSEDIISVFPNPASDKIYINSRDQIQGIGLYDIQGKLIFSTIQIDPNKSIDISSLKEGIYFLHIKQRDKTTIHKIIKQ